MKSIEQLTAAELRAAADIKEKIQAAKNELDIIFGNGVPQTEDNCVTPFLSSPPESALPRRKLHWTQTPEGRRRMKRIQRKAWRTTRAAQRVNL